jgi:hypothetical protein
VAGSERLLSLLLQTCFGPVSLLSAYAPTLDSTPEEKDQFYQALDETISRTTKTTGLYLLGDLNARVGADLESWPTCLGRFGRGKINENGQRQLELLCRHALCVTNTFFHQQRKSTRCQVDTRGLTSGISLTSSPGERRLETFSYSAAIRARTAIRITHSRPAGCAWRRGDCITQKVWVTLV